MLPSETFPVLTPKLAAVVTALSNGEIPVTLVLGEPGVGKSYAVREAVHRLAASRVVVEAKPKMGARGLAEAMIREATENPLLSLEGRVLSRDQLTEMVIDELYDDDLLIVIDDAHRLPENALSWLASVHVLGAARLVLIGTPSLTERLPDELCRVARSIRMEPISEQKTPWLVRQLHPIYMGAQRETILEVHRSYSEGILARWARFTDRAAAICSVERIPLLNDYVVKAVLHHFKEVDEAA